MLAAALAVLAFAHGNAITTMSADGSGARRVTTGGDPAFSPSGDMLAFTRRRGNRRSDIWVSAPDGTNARRLVRSDPGYTSGVGSPAWSPDRSAIAFTSVTVSAAGRVAKVEVVGRDGRNRRTVIVIKSPGFESMTDPTWTPDGRILYMRARELPHDRYAFDLRSVAADGSGDALFLRNAASAAFSPDGTRIAFSSMHSGDAPIGDLGVANADGSGRHIIFKSESDEGTPRWSPDGARIAFTSGRNVPDEEFLDNEVYTIAPDGSCLTWLTNGDVDSGEPAWAPGGSSSLGCGTDRPPLQELRAPARATWWVGRSFGTVMLSFTSSGVIGGSSYERIQLALGRGVGGGSRGLAVATSAQAHPADWSYRPGEVFRQVGSSQTGMSAFMARKAATPGSFSLVASNPLLGPGTGRCAIS